VLCKRTIQLTFENFEKGKHLSNPRLLFEILKFQVATRLQLDLLRKMIIQLTFENFEGKKHLGEMVEIWKFAKGNSQLKLLFEISIADFWEFRGRDAPWRDCWDLKVRLQSRRESSKNIPVLRYTYVCIFIYVYTCKYVHQNVYIYIYICI